MVGVTHGYSSEQSLICTAYTLSKAIVSPTVRKRAHLWFRYYCTVYTAIWLPCIAIRNRANTTGTIVQRQSTDCKKHCHIRNKTRYIFERAQTILYTHCENSEWQSVNSRYNMLDTSQSHWVTTGNVYCVAIKTHRTKHSVVDFTLLEFLESSLWGSASVIDN